MNLVADARPNADIFTDSSKPEAAIRVATFEILQQNLP